MFVGVIVGVGVKVLVCVTVGVGVGVLVTHTSLEDTYASPFPVSLITKTSPV